MARSRPCQPCCLAPLVRCFGLLARRGPNDRKNKPRSSSAHSTSLLHDVLDRPSDGRGPGENPRPQYAFKMSMFNVSCNSH